MSPNSSDVGLSRTLASTATLRLSKLHASDHFCTPIEERFERITRLAQQALRVPVAAITLLRPEIQWFKSVSGWRVSQLPINKSLCAITLDASMLTIIPDTALDVRCKDHPLVKGAPNFRFYVGHPLFDSSARIIGTFCAMDVRPRMLSAGSRQAVSDLAMVSQLELLADRLADAQAELISKLSIARREAMIDELTRLWNRRGGEVLLRNALARAARQHSPLSIAMLDLDRFKLINDLHGHQVGDDALRRVAKILTANLRDSDMACRYGGDEFVVLLQDTDAKRASDTMDRVRAAVQAAKIRIGNELVPLTVSIGLVVHDLASTCTPNELVARADEALTYSKSQGKNQVNLAS